MEENNRNPGTAALRDFRFERLGKGAFSGCSLVLLSAFVIGISAIGSGPAERFDSAWGLVFLFVIPAAICGAVGASFDGFCRSIIVATLILVGISAANVVICGWRGRNVAEMAWAALAAIALGGLCGGLGSIAGRTTKHRLPGSNVSATRTLTQVAVLVVLAGLAIVSSLLAGW